MSTPVSAVLMVKNERDRLVDALDSVAWAGDVVVADTGSTDGTQDLARGRGARVVEIPWEGFVRSRNRALAEARHDWVLALDADERVSPELRDAILAVLADGGESVAGISTPRLSSFLGCAVRHGTWYPDVKLRLGRRSRGFRCEGGRVHEANVVDGPVARVEAPLLHTPYRDVSDALRKASRYAQLGAEDRFERGARGTTAALTVRPVAEFLRCYVVKAGFLDGRVGVAVALLHAASYFLRAAFLMDLEREGRSRVPGPLREEEIR